MSDGPIQPPKPAVVRITDLPPDRDDQTRVALVTEVLWANW
jgi:hypothetical protein